MKKIFAIKSIVAVSIFGMYFVLRNVFYPTLTNEQALKQLEDTTASFTDFTLYQIIWNFAWIIPVIMCILIFWKNIRNLFFRIKGGYY